MAKDELKKEEVIKKGNNGRKYRKDTRKSSVKSGSNVQSTKMNPITAQVNNIGDLNFVSPVEQEIGPLNGSVAHSELGDPSKNYYARQFNIFTFGFIPTLGDTKTANLAAQKTFGEMRKKLNVPTTYEAGDLFCLIQAVQSINVTLEFCKKLVRLAGTYLPLNKLYPNLALSALEQDRATIVAGSPTYRDRINKLLSACAYMYIPTNYLSNVIRCELASHIYSDAESPKAQTIIPYPEGMWKWNLSSGTSTSPANLEWVSFKDQDQFKTLKEILDAVEDCVYSLLSDSDAQRIFGDILKVWEDQVWTIPQDPITEDQEQEITYDPVFLYMLHNATILEFSGDCNDPTINWVVPQGGSSPALVQEYHVNGVKYIGAAELIDLPDGMTPTPEDVINMCRWKYYTNSVSQWTNNKVNILGSEMLVPFEILVNLDAHCYTNGTADRVPIDTSYFYIEGQTLPEPTLSIREAISPLSVSPLIYVTVKNNNWPYPRHIIGDRNNYALVTAYYVKRVQSILTQINYLL